MKQILLFVIIAIFGVSDAYSQQYKLIITKDDGTSLEMKTSEIVEMYFEEYTEEEQETHVDTLSYEDIERAQKILDGDIVLSSRLTMNGVDKTLVENGCPVIYNFSWNEDSTMKISQYNMTLGSMGMTINFSCKATPMALDSWEKNEYTGDGWIKFYGKDGVVTSSDEDTEHTSSNAYIQGYVNVETNEIQFIISYNMMNIRSEVFLQTIDKDRINHYEEEYAQYEKDLEEYKNSVSLY